MPKQEYKILEFHGGTNNKFDPRDIAENQNAYSQFSINRVGRLVKEGDAKNLYSPTDINGHTITDITATPGGFEPGYGLFSFSHDYSMESTPDEVDTEFICINDANGIDIYDANQSSDEWQDNKFYLGSRTATVKPEYYNVDGALRVCDSNFGVTDVGINTDLAIDKNDVVIGIDNSAAILAGAVIQINQEIMYVIAGGDAGAVDEITVIRGFANTKIVSHLTGQSIYFVNIPKYFGHIKQDRLFECASSNSINAWVEDVQTPQPPNNTRKSDTTRGILASSNGIQSLRIFDSVEGSTSNYPSESEKVNLEFSEAPATLGIIKVEHIGANVLKLTTSGKGSSPTAAHGLKQGMNISIHNPQTVIAGITVTDLTNLAGSYQVLSTPTTTTFTIQNTSFTDDMNEDATVSVDDTYTATVDGWTDIGGDGGDYEGFVKVSNDETNLPGLQSSAAEGTEFWIHITGQTGVLDFNGIKRAYKVDTDDLRFETSSHASVADVSGTTEIQQLLAIVRPEDSNAINEDLKRKWNFAMSFTYDGPAQEVQESLLTMGHSLAPVAQTDGTNNLINVADGSTIMVNGNSPGAGNWTERDTDGGTDGFLTFDADTSPIVFDKSENQDSSAINTLGTAIVSGKRYKVVFTVAGKYLNIAIGGGDLTGNTMDNEFVSATQYGVGTHTVQFQATAAATHLWFTVDSSASEGDGTLDTFSCVESGYGSGATDIVVDDGTVFSVGEVIYIGTEQLYISGINTHTLTVERGYNGSTAAHFPNDSLVYRMTELSPTQTVDWTNFTGAPNCVIKTVYNYGVDEKSWNARINGFKIYMKDVTEKDSSKDWRLFSHVNFNKGTYTLFAAGDSELILEQPGSDWTSDGQICTISTGTDLTMRPIDTYLSENFFTEETIIDAQYKVSCVAGRKVYVGNIKQGGRTYPDRMLRTPINKFDTFPETNFIDVAIGDGDAITDLESFGDRLLQFKKNKLYVINIAGESEVLESEYPNAGVYTPSQVVKTNRGIAWINPSGVWFFDGQQVNNLTRQVEGSMYNENEASTRLIGFDNRTNRIIYTPFKSNGMGTTWFVYDLELQAYQSYYDGTIFPHAESAANYYTNFINDKKGNLVLGYADAGTPTEINFYQWDSNAGEGQSTNLTNMWKSKDIDLASPSINKKIYKVYVTYKCTGHSGIQMKYATNGSGSFSGTFSSSKSTNYDADSFTTNGTSTGFKNTDGAWAVAELRPSSSINNIKSIQFSFDHIYIHQGTAQTGGGTSSIKLASSGVVATAGAYDDYNIYIYAGPARYNTRIIENGTNGTTYSPDGSSRVATVLSSFTDKGYGNDANSTSTKYILGAIATDFEINDITVIYRPKRVK